VTGAVGLSLPLWPTVFYIPLALCFYYFLLAGSRTFDIRPEDDLSSGIAQFLFYVSGMLGTIFLGYRQGVRPLNAVAGAALMVLALALYEWARHTIFPRRYRIAWSGDVPDEVCEDGPYRYVRHPIYASYMLAFAALLAAIPSPWSLAIFAVNVTLFVHAAFDDERSLARSELAVDYADYRRRTGMFVPRRRRQKLGDRGG
jgi:protein-S-isoprenylcysteine O-methyltransferase Ste14